MNKKIILVINDFAGGNGYIAKELLENFLISNEVTLICLSDRNNSLFHEVKKKYLIKFSEGYIQSIKSFILIYFKTLKLVHKNKNNIYVITFDNRSNIYTYIMKIFTNINWIATIHGLTSPFIYKNKIINKIILRKANYVIANSKALQKKLSKNYNHENILTISPGIKSIRLKEEKRIPRLLENKYIPVRLVHLANFYSSVKSHDQSLMVLKYLDDGGINCFLNFIGDGVLKEKHINMAKEMNIYEKVNFHGFLNDDNKYRIIVENDICLMPSRSEAFGIASLECMSLGLPVIASNIPGQNELIIDGYNGLLFEVNNIKEFANKIKLLINNKSLYEKLSHGAKETARKYSINNMISSYKNIIN